MQNTADVVIIGAGIWGLSTAWHLRHQDASIRVLVLERNASPADETSRVSAGQVGQLRTDPLLVRGVGYTLDWLASFKEITGHDPCFTQTGSLHVALNEARSQSFAQQIDEASQLGVEVVSVDSRQMQELVPGLHAESVHSGIFIPGDGYVETQRTTLALRDACVDAGVHLECGNLVQSIQPGESSTTVKTNSGYFSCSKVLIAAGPWTPHRTTALGTPLPVQAIHLQQARTAPGACIHPRQPVLRVPDCNAYIRPELGGYLFGVFNTDPESMDVPDRTSMIETNRERISDLQQSLSPVIPEIGALAIDQYRQGAVTCTPDGGYVLGPLNAHPDIFVATGCGARGIAGSGAIGNWLSHWMREGDPGDDLHSFHPERFGEKSVNHEWVKTQSENTFANYYTLPETSVDAG